MCPRHLLAFAVVALLPGTALAVPAYTVPDLGTLGGHNPSDEIESWGNDINARGQVTGFSITAAGFTHTFLWDPATGMRDLGTLGGFNSSAFGINARGQVTGWSTSADGFVGAFLWDPVAGMLDLNYLIAPGSGWILGQGNAINDAGQITGSGTIGGQTHAFLLTPVTVAEVPEPGTLALVGAGLIGLDLARRRGARDGTETQNRAG